MHVRTNPSSAFDEMGPPSFSMVTTAAAGAFRASNALDLRRDPIHLSEILPVKPKCGRNRSVICW